MPTTKTILTKSKDWSSFKRTVDTLDNKAKGDAFEGLTQHFFQINPTYRTKLKNVWNVNKQEVPSRIHKKLNLPSPDLGIDLLAETNEGEFWAIQCKYHSDQSKSLTKNEIDSCMNLAFGHCKGISLAIVCTTAEKYSRNLRGFAEDKLSYRDGSVWRALDENFFKAVRKNLKGQSQPIKAFKPRPHQKRAIKNAAEHFITNKNERGKMIMPCGSGKSLTGYWIANEFKAKKILLAVPSLALIKQTLEVWAEQSVANKKDVRWICVCSDKSVGDISNDDVAVQLQDLGIKIHTDPTEIASWLKKRSSAITVVFTTYQSGEAISKAAKKAKYSFDLGICDEAHKTVGAKGKVFSHLLYEKNIKVKRRLFMTATERRYGGSTDKVISMDDHKLYGETFELLSFKEALECKPAILSDYKIITIGITQQEIRENIKKNILVKPSKGAWKKETEIQMLTAALALRKAIKLKGIKHAVSFHSSIARAEAFRETQDRLTKHIKGFGKLDTFHVSAKVPTADREKLLNEFAESKRSLITNARCLTEGVDVKQIDCVVFADPKKSAVDIVQAVGRALRPFEGKKYGYVIVPQLIDSKTVKGRIEQNESFKDILMALRALAANDERIVEYFRSVSEGKKVLKRDTLVEFVTQVGTEIDCKQFEDKLKLKVWGRLAKLSWRPFEQARSFASALKLKNTNEWIKYASGKLYNLPPKPIDIPASPARIYNNLGWKGFGHWLNTGNLNNQDRSFLNFFEARDFVRKLKLNSQKEWIIYSSKKRPNFIPANPNIKYKEEGWIDVSDWLGVNNRRKKENYKNFEDARKHIRNLKFKSNKEWTSYVNGNHKHSPIPHDIPKNPEYVYKNKYVGISDWLGIRGRNRNNAYWSFEKARKYVRKLKLNNLKEWHLHAKGNLKSIPFLPAQVPSRPERIYSTEWIDYSDWLGIKITANQNRIYKNFKDAKFYVRTLKLKDRKDWDKYIKGKKSFKKPDDIPAVPWHVYKNNGWKSLGDWLGTGFVARSKMEYISFEKARNTIHKLKFQSQSEWYLFMKGLLPEKGKVPKGIPTAPHIVYKNTGWISFMDWFGKYSKITSVINNNIKLKINTKEKYRQLFYASKGDQKLINRLRIPIDPALEYKNTGWKGWDNFLGKTK